jgi:hypothetical protein
MSEFILSNYVPNYSHQLAVVDSIRMRCCFNSSFYLNSSLYFLYVLFHLNLDSYIIGLCLFINKTTAQLCNNSTYKDLSSMFHGSDGTRIALHVNMDDKSLHFLHDGKFSSYVIIIIIIIIII